MQQRRRSLMIAAGALTLGGATQSRAPVISVAELRKIDAMTLADRILPKPVRAKVIDGFVRRQFVPGNAFRAAYTTRPRVAGRDLCVQDWYAVELASNTPPPGPSGTDLYAGPMTTKLLSAVVFPARTATDRSCAATKGFLDMSGPTGDRQLAAYRTLVRAMRIARSAAPLPFIVTCKEPDGSPCSDARRSLAELPLDALFAIDAGSYRGFVTIDKATGKPVTKMLSGPDQRRDVEFSFGMSGDDGASWRVSFDRVTDGGLPPGITMSRRRVIYH